MIKHLFFCFSILPFIFPGAINPTSIAGSFTVVRGLCPNFNPAQNYVSIPGSNLTVTLGTNSSSFHIIIPLNTGVTWTADCIIPGTTFMKGAEFTLAICKRNHSSIAPQNITFTIFFYENTLALQYQSGSTTCTIVSMNHNNRNNFNISQIYGSHYIKSWKCNNMNQYCALKKNSYAVITNIITDLSFTLKFDYEGKGNGCTGTTNGPGSWEGTFTFVG